MRAPNRLAGSGALEVSGDRLVWRGEVPEGHPRAELVLSLLTG